MVDDDLSIRELVRRVLLEMNFEVAAAESGNEALRLLAAGASPHFVVTDYQMDDGDGLSLLRGIRAQEHLKEVPVVLVTGMEDLSFARGFDSTLRKPFTDCELLNALTSLYPVEV